MIQKGVFVGKQSKALAKRILDFYEDVRYNYLSAKEDPKEYRKNWITSVKKIRKDFDGLGEFSALLKKFLEEDNVFSKNALNPESYDAKKLYDSIKEMRFNSDELNDPFAKQMGDKVIENLLRSPPIYAMFIHYAIRSHPHSIKSKAWEKHDLKPDKLTNGAMGLDLAIKDVPLYIMEHYGDGKDNKRVEDKFESALELLKKVYLEQGSEEDWDKLVDIDLKKSEEEKAEIDFIIPNKPMYRIFEVDDIKDLKGFSGEWVVQEKYDGIRIQIHKANSTVKVYTYNEKDISDKCEHISKILKQKKFGEMILDAELILYDGDEPLHRADTIAHLFKNKYKDATLKAKVFDIMSHDGSSHADNPLRERINILQYQLAQHSEDVLEFPNKKNTRIADSLKEIEKYAKDIMESPTAEGVVIKDIESTYYIGSRKNPKWIKFKKFVDLDVIVLDKKKTKSNLYSYSVGVGPLSGEESRNYDGIEYEGKTYLQVGKALNTKENVEIGSIVRVKVDEVRRAGKGFSLYSAKVIEIPEVETPEKVVTLELLSKDGRKSLKYNVEEALLKYTITDGIHGTAEILLKSNYEGFNVYGIEGDNLMEKNAIADMDMWKEQLDDINKGRTTEAIVKIKQYLQNKDPKERGVHVKDIFEFIQREDEQITEALFENNARKLKNWMNDQDAFIPRSGQKFAANSKVLIKDGEESDSKYGTFKLYTRKDDNIDFIITYKKKTFAWTIDIDKTKDIYNLFGKSGKYPAEVSRGVQKDKLLDSGKILMGVQRHGYHEYKLEGDKFETRLHLRVIPVKDQDTWLAWTGIKQKMLERQEEEGLWDITEDRHKKLTMQIE
tara:strand:+ start:6117 stop:8627 length:2511 start_codon:yes stop_codon:yes gene_type:complete